MKKILVLQNIGCEDLGTMEAAIRSRDMKFEYIHLYNNAPPPKNLESYSGLIVLGGPMNVYETDKYLFLIEEERLIKEAMENDIPTLGICLGAQLIAKTAGAKVYAGDKKEIGWYPVSLTNESLSSKLFAGFEKDMTVFQWHGDTFDIPVGAERLAGSELFVNQAFKIKEKIIGLQFHLEITEKAIYKWIAEYQEELDSLKDYINPDKIKEVTKEKIKILNTSAGKFYQNFFNMVNEN